MTSPSDEFRRCNYESCLGRELRAMVRNDLRPRLEILPPCSLERQFGIGLVHRLPDFPVHDHA